MTTARTYPPMPIRASPYRHQQEAYEFALRMFGLHNNDDRTTVVQPSSSTQGPLSHEFSCVGHAERQTVDQSDSRTTEGGDPLCQKPSPNPEASPF